MLFAPLVWLLVWSWQGDRFLLYVAAALVSLALILATIHFFIDTLESLWQLNLDAANDPVAVGNVIRLLRRHLPTVAHWYAEDNARRGNFDPAVEALIADQKLSMAERLVEDKLLAAHASGETIKENMYRRYRHVIISMGSSPP